MENILQLVKIDIKNRYCIAIVDWFYVKKKTKQKNQSGLLKSNYLTPKTLQHYWWSFIIRGVGIQRSSGHGGTLCGNY